MALKDWLRRINPQQGRFVRENGTVTNVADTMDLVRDGYDPFKHLHTAEYTPILERSPRPGFSVLRDRTVPDGVSVPVVNGELELDGTTQKLGLYTRKRGRYLPGLIGSPGVRFRIVDPTIGHYEYGYGDEFGNRMGLEWDGGEVYTFVESAGNRYYRKHRSEWLDPLDGTGPSRISADLNGLTLRQPFGWYGGLTVQFELGVPSRLQGDRFVTIDRSAEDNLASGVTIQEPNLPIFAEADGGVGYVGGRQYGVYGRYRPEFRTTATRNTQKTGIGTTFAPIVSLRVRDEIAFRGISVIFGGAGIITTENAEFAIFVDATLTGANFQPVADIPTGESALEQDSAATALSGGYRVYSDNVVGGQGSKAGGSTRDLPDFNLPNDGMLTLAARALGTSTDVDGVLRMLEEN